MSLIIPTPSQAAFRSLLAPMRAAVHRRAEFESHLLAHYIEYSRDDALRTALEHLVTALGAAAEHGKETSLGIVSLVGPPRTGKTEALLKVLKELFGSDNKSVRYVKAPSSCTLRQFARTVLDSLNYPTQDSMQENEAWRKARKQLVTSGTLILVVDELNNVLTSSAADQMNLRKALKGLVQMVDWPMGLVLGGVDAVSLFLGQDRQIEGRSETVEFAPLSFPKDCELVEKTVREVIEDHARMDSAELITDDFVHRLIVAMRGSLGAIITLTRSAILIAYDRSGEGATVGWADFAASYRAQTVAERSQNLFLVKDWTNIDPRNSRSRSYHEADVTQTSSKKQKTGAK